MTELSKKTCSACEIGAPLVPHDEQLELLKDLDGWIIDNSDISKLIKVGPSESMSKSKKNTIDPENIIETYGSDAVRLFILSDSPPEKDVQWSEQGMVASHKFVQKLWLLNCKIKEKIRKCSDKKDQEGDLEIERFTNQLIFKMNNNLEKFNYNVIIASMYETYNFLNQKINSPINSDLLSIIVLIESVICISPPFPFVWLFKILNILL